MTNVSTPTTSPASFTAGPPLLPQAAAASVWITGWLARSCLKPEIAPLVMEASILADEFKSSWLNTTPGNPMMCMRSPIRVFAESASASVGMSAASSLSNARSWPDIASPATGGLYLTTLAGSRTPLAISTEIDGSSLARPVPLRSPQTCLIAFCVCSRTSHSGGRYAGETTWPLVMSQPEDAMNQPVPVSRKGAGVTVVSAPAPQRTATSPATSEITRATAGFARSNAS